LYILFLYFIYNFDINYLITNTIVTKHSIVMAKAKQARHKL